LDSKKIIVVEDKAIIALDIKIYLTRNGYNNTISFLSGDTALEYLNENKPDLALIDVILHSDVDGIDLAKELKKRSIPFIFVSAFSNPRQYEEAVQLNPAAIFIKPINLNEILVKIREILRNNSGQNKKINRTKNYH
jgi:DNA-binding response OmpR family regulator